MHACMLAPWRSGAVQASVLPGPACTSEPVAQARGKSIGSSSAPQVRSEEANEDVCCVAGLRFLSDAEVDELVAGIEAEKAAADAARRGTSAPTS